MFKANLLNTGEEYIYKKQKIIGDNVFEDLKITKIFEFCAPLNFDSISSKDIKHTLEILKTPCQVKKDILFRQKIFRKFLSSGNFVNDLYNALREVNVLQRIRETYDFDYGGERDIDYLKAVNYIFFIKSYKLYIDNIYNAVKNTSEKFELFDSDETFEDSGLYNFFNQIELEKNKIDSSEISEPVEEFLSYFADKKNIIGELKTQSGVFTTFNFDTEIKNIKSTYPQKIPFFDLIKNIEDFLDIYRQEYEIKEKGKSLRDDSDELYIPEKYTNFEKHFILQLIYDEETENETSFAPVIKKIIEIHDNIDISYFVIVFDQMKFYRTMCKIISVISENTENQMCYPDVREDFVKLSLTELFDPVIAVQKLAEYQEKNNTSNLPDKKIDDIIPNDLSFGEKNLFVITGPNNGGKTAFVRAAGISVIFFGAGAPVFAKSADLSVGINIHSHFTVNETHLKESGRLQDELNRLNSVIEKSDEYSFIILNETFAGTNSIKALTLFENFLNDLEKRKFLCVYVTHFHNIAFSVEDMQSMHENVKDANKLPAYNKCDNLIAYLDETNGGVRTYKILPMKPSDTSYSKDIVLKHNLSWEQLRANLKI